MRDPLMEGFKLLPILGIGMQSLAFMEGRCSPLGQRINYASRNSKFSPYAGENTNDLVRAVSYSMGMLYYPNQDRRIIKLRDYATRMCTSFIRSFHSNMRKEFGKQSYQEFYDKCKDRASDLSQLRERMSRLFDIEDLLYVPRGYTEPLDIRNTKYFGKGGKFYAVLEEDIVVVGTIKFQPQWYVSLYKAMYSAMRLYCELRQEEDLDGSKCAMQVALQVQSWGNIFDELRSNKFMTLMQEEAIFSTLSEAESAELSEDSELLTVFSEVVKDIEEGQLLYVSDFSNSLREHNLERRRFSSSDYYISGKSTAYRHTDKTLNVSILSSAYETDPFLGCQFDEITGYESNYNVLFKGDGFPHPMITLSIPQGKIKRRIIHVGCNAIQDRGRYIHCTLQKFNSRLASDCTIDQRSGISFAARVSSPRFRSTTGYPSILCMDFSNATDLLSQEFQNLCLGILYPEPIVDFWREASKMEKVFLFSDGSERKYNQRRGQPQGLLGSFDCFALAHHVIMLMVMKITNRTNYRATQFYRILGDDSIICSITEDRNHEVKSAYLRVCQWAGLEINESKSHVVGFEDKNSALCEFAKVAILNGEISTPVPIRLLSRTGKDGSNYHRMSCAMWMAVNGYDQLRTEIHRLLPTMFSEEAIPIASSIIRSGIIPAFSMFADYNVVDRCKLDQGIFCYLVEKLKGTFFNALLKDESSEKFFDDCQYDIEKLSPFLIEESRMEAILDVVENPNHKIMVVLQKNLDLQDSIKSILGVYTEKRLLTGAVDLTVQEMRLYIWVADIMANIKLGIPLPSISRDEWVDLLRGAATLDRFMPRAFHKKTLREIVYLDNAIKRIPKIFDYEDVGVGTILEG